LLSMALFESAPIYVEDWEVITPGSKSTLEIGYEGFS
jgi:hypothetical protein